MFDILSNRINNVPQDIVILINSRHDYIYRYVRMDFRIKVGVEIDQLPKTEIVDDQSISNPDEGMASIILYDGVAKKIFDLV